MCDFNIISVVYINYFSIFALTNYVLLKHNENLYTHTEEIILL